MTYCFLDKTISLENIKIDSMFKLENGSKRSFLYIINSKEKLCLLFIKTSRLRLIYDLKLSEYGTAKLPMYPYFKETKAFVKIIKALEKKIKKHFQGKGEFVSCLNLKKNSLKTIKLNFKKNLFIKSVLGNVSINDVNQDGQLKLMIKIPYVWFRDDKYGLSLIVEQAKYYPSPTDLEIDFWSDSDDDEYILPKSKVTRIDQCQNCQSKSYHLFNEVKGELKQKLSFPKRPPIRNSRPPPLPKKTPPPKKSSSGGGSVGGMQFAISLQAIQSAKSKLKKTNSALI